MLSQKDEIRTGQDCLLHQELHAARKGRAKRGSSSRAAPFVLYTALLDGRREVKPPCAAR
ncbi:MAG: hypothetical protein CL534_19210 [Ahrensia sp.]|nr:hypothetical protein [Ahrensia sp.]